MTAGTGVVRISDIYATEETWRRYDLAVDALGWSKKLLVQQCISAYFKGERLKYYQTCAVKDYTARGMTEKDYYKVLRFGKEADLPDYQTQVVNFGESRISRIAPISTEHGRKFNTIKLGGYNYVLLRLARIVDGRSMSQVVSRIMHSHFEDYWKVYQMQIEFDEQCSFSSGGS